MDQIFLSHSFKCFLLCFLFLFIFDYFIPLLNSFFGFFLLQNSSSIISFSLLFHIYSLSSFCLSFFFNRLTFCLSRSFNFRSFTNLFIANLLILWKFLFTKRDTCKLSYISFFISQLSIFRLHKRKSLEHKGRITLRKFPRFEIADNLKHFARTEFRFQVNCYASFSPSKYHLLLLLFMSCAPLAISFAHLSSASEVRYARPQISTPQYIVFFSVDDERLPLLLLLLKEESNISIQIHDAQCTYHGIQSDKDIRDPCINQNT